jgi:hypothetical protein
MTRAEQYRAYALETEALAHRTADRGARATLQGVAMQWRNRWNGIHWIAKATGRTTAMRTT